ncbi:hypothetical protein CFBP498_49340 (plasmid) [Xanthomonas hortorum pv. vitians]|uniref:DUF5677 domain-containing protein n=1 Tax=Xanthomonas hortorum pv. vitians TaxID=83224 RepID=A0A6V7FJ21_9XANT|nr:DUF5677 domain-containing protein [Xanthomonas hortorum]MDT7826039.1 DUF5677 domain-containing protein [Xanthomonas hortorum pv. vitians]MDV7248560.1 DUF5677 domain-containing protein [Xanthomonas hortorum pv. vitians]NMI33253.1 hypothetical protein [Xanthomonas hortorum pv. vitians]CAD0363741.1 hypothetical protein CFBP498_49340 [Xanthomonas hortorum pv. vitians]CAD0363743.1 hypothetical protein CFBP498_49340 [Xanthomonas hortorum pv. vitians]
MSLDKADLVVRKAEAQFKELAPQVGEDQELALQFWAKLIANSKVVVSLASAHHGSPAAMVHRVSIEHFAYMYGLVNGVITVEGAEQQFKSDIHKNAKGLDSAQRRDDRAGRDVLTQENRQHIAEFLGNTDNQVADPGISVYNILGALDLDFVYTIYRLYSVNASHANVFSCRWNPTETEIMMLLDNVKDLLEIAGLVWRKGVGNSQPA